jgi:hypothetical protein
MNLVALWKLYFFYLVLMRLGYAGQRTTIAPTYRPEGGNYVHQGHTLMHFVRSVLVPSRRDLQIRPKL